MGEEKASVYPHDLGKDIKATQAETASVYRQTAGEQSADRMPQARRRRFRYAMPHVRRRSYRYSEQKVVPGTV